jgi:hypothetical protein
MIKYKEKTVRKSKIGEKFYSHTRAALDLKDVTLFCIDDLSPKKAADLIERLSGEINFGDVKLFSSREEEGVTNVLSSPINTLYDYSLFAINDLYKHINTDFALCIQRDGYPVNAKAWRDDFFNYDYIGAPWLWAPVGHADRICPVGNCVGNGGFSLRSRALMEEAAKYSYADRWKEIRSSADPATSDKDILNEDEFICREISNDLKSSGFKFAPVEIAHSFSIENMAYTGQFGFHGTKTMLINQKLGIFETKAKGEQV